MASETARYPDAPRGPIRRTSAFLNRSRGGRLALTIAPPLGWMVVVYLGALTLMIVTAFWRLDPLTSEVQQVWGLQNFETIYTGEVYRAITLRTLATAIAVTVTDVALAFPIAYYMARMASRRMRNILLVAVVLPLWSSYLVRAFAWKTILGGGGPADWLLETFLGIEEPRIGASGWAVWLTFSYLWLPFVILPVYAALERVPASLLEASGDLGARGLTTFRRVVWPLAFPGVVAGSIFAFSLTLGDYITPTLVGNRFFIGNAIYNFVGIGSNLPLAAAFATVPIVIVAIYLSIAKRLGAFEAL